MVNRGTGRTVTEASEHPTGVGATAGVRSRDAARAKFHAVAPEEPMPWRRFIRQPSDAPVAVGVTVGGCSRDDAQTKSQRVKHQLNRCREKQGVGLTGG